MKPPRNAVDYRKAIIEFGSRSYTKTMFHGFAYRFLIELLREDDSVLPKQIPDVNAYELAHLSLYQAGTAPRQHETTRFSFSHLQDLVDTPLPSKGQSHVMFLSGHLPGSWISSIGAKYGIAPEFFRRHIHLWRSSEGPVLHNVPWMPSCASGKGLSLRINTQGYSQRPLGNVPLAGRRKLLPEILEANPMRLTGAPGSSYVRGHAILSDWQFLIEQDISITIESDGEGWAAILWSDVGHRDLSKSHDFHPFMKHLTACSKTGLRSIRLIPSTMVGIDSKLEYSLPPTSSARVDPIDDGALVQLASHLASECHYLIDHNIAAQDPLYAITPVFTFAAATESQILGVIAKRYDIISSTVWNPKESSAFLEQLILHKHILDDHARRHEEVLRFLRSDHAHVWAADLTKEQAIDSSAAKRAVEDDYDYLLARCRQFSTQHQEAISVLVSSVALAESKKQITLAKQVTKLTVLATVFLPLSYCTSIFGMNFVELDQLSIWIWAVVTVSVGIATLVVYQWDEKHRVSRALGTQMAPVGSRLHRMLYGRSTDLSSV